MNTEQLRNFCLTFPGATEDVKWGADLCFCVGAKMFCVTGVDSNLTGLSIKCTPETFSALIEIDGIDPAAYVGRYGWVRISKLDSLSIDRLKELISTSYQLVFEKLPRNVRNAIH